jgi:CheY-like chemotaxis protein
MGLATVYGIVSQASGHIRLDSTPGSGTTANILLPVTQRATASRALRATTAVEPATKGRGETILLVEDEPGVRALTRRMLVRNGYTVLEADNGGEALRMIERGVAFDLLLSDLITPEMSGIELVARIRSTQPDVRVLFMSGYTEESLAELGIDGRGESVVRKPFTEAKLLGQVRTALA